MGNVEKYGRYAGQHTILNNQSEHQEVKKNISEYICTMTASLHVYEITYRFGSERAKRN